MNRALAWIKGNPITVASAALAIAAVVALGMIASKSGAFTERMADRDKIIRSILTYQRTLVTIPPANPDDPERELNIVVNQAAIDQLNKVYSRLERESAEIFRLAVELNRHNHAPMVDGLFPEPTTTDSYKRFEAGGIYRQLIVEMLGPHSAAATTPRLNAGPAPDLPSLGPVIDRVQKEFLATQVFPANKPLGELTADELAELEQAKSRKLVAMLQERAQAMHLYIGSRDIESAAFPFDVGAWSDAKNKPEMADIWGGQVGLWVQQDLAEVIARTNRVDDPAFNVMNAPVKRLIKIELVPGYVGIDGRGAFAADSAAAGPANPPMPGQTPREVPFDFTASPTGRVSNPMYDVRHVRLSMIVDVQGLAAFFENLHKVNFMTVLSMKLANVDEYEQLRRGYVYGSGDAVQADLVIETIWLREWTVQYMPETVRTRLGIEPDPGRPG